MRIKVSIITPSWNSEKYIAKTIDSVQKQSYTEWEMVIVDDCSTDSTCRIVEEYMQKDSRIRLIRQEKNMGAGAARTRGMREATGRFIAYLDADDLWKPDKLKKQLAFMLKKKAGFSCASYEVINNEGMPVGKDIHMLPALDYKGFLTNNLLQTVGIMVDTKIVDRELLVMPNMRRRQDAATWLQVLRAGHTCYGIYEILAEYRRTANSLSSNKVKASYGVWRLYRDVEKLSLPFSIYCFVRYAILAVSKRIYRK